MLISNLHQAKVAAHKALDDFIVEVSNDPHSRLDTAMNRARALYGLLWCIEYELNPDHTPSRLKISREHFTRLLEKWSNNE